MSVGFKIVVNEVADELRDAIQNMDLPVKQACVAAIEVAGIRAIDLGRSDISVAGFGHRWQDTWKVNFYQDNPPQIDAAAWLYHKIPYAEIFQDGGTIVGKPFLWIPLRNAPKNFGRGHITPKKLRADGIKLFSINRPGKVPLLATKVFVSRAKARKTNFNVTRAALRRSRTIPKNVGKQVRMTVPLFFGIRAVHERKRFHLAEIVATQRDLLPQYYVANLKD